MLTFFWRFTSLWKAFFGVFFFSKRRLKKSSFRTLAQNIPAKKNEPYFYRALFGLQYFMSFSFTNFDFSVVNLWSQTKKVFSVSFWAVFSFFLGILVFIAQNFEILHGQLRLIFGQKTLAMTLWKDWYNKIITQLRLKVGKFQTVVLIM